MSANDPYTNYVVNAGPLNTQPMGAPTGTGTVTYGEVEFGYVPANGTMTPQLKDAKWFTIFFDRLALTGTWSGVAGTKLCDTKVKVEDISQMDGTSVTILLTENEDAGEWIWGNGANDKTGLPTTSMDTTESIEAYVGFCYPRTFVDPLNVVGNANYQSIGSGEPLFINEGRKGAAPRGVETARPSSGHPGIVVAAFCDGSVRPLKDEMSRELFIQLCRPNSGVVLNPKDMDW